MAANGYKIAVATYPWHGIIEHQTSAWIIKTILKMRKDPRISSVLPLYMESNCPISMLRAHSVNSAMNERCDYILMIDYDMSPDSIIPGLKPFWDEAWEFTMERRCREEADHLMPATIAAPYLADAAEERFFAYEFDEGAVSRGEHENMRLIDKADALSRRGMGTVLAAQTGLILYDMRVFWYMPKPWFAYEWKNLEQEEVNLADDFYQTRNLSLAGLPVYMAWDCWSGHLKSKLIARPPYEHRDCIS